MCPPAATPPQQPAFESPSSHVRIRKPDGSERPKQCRDGSGEKAIARRDPAVVRVVADVRRDPGERRQGSAPQVAREAVEADELAAARRPAGDVVVVDERVVALRVAAGVAAAPAGRRHILEVRSPGDPRRRELVDEVGSGDGAARAVGGDPVRRAARQREVVGQRGVRDRKALRREPVAPREAVHIWCRRAPEDGRRLLVLHQDHDDVGRPRGRDVLDRQRPPGRRGATARHERGERRERR